MKKLGRKSWVGKTIGKNPINHEGRAVREVIAYCVITYYQDNCTDEDVKKARTLNISFTTSGKAVPESELLRYVCQIMSKETEKTNTKGEF